jgi:hypothetical protein
MTYTIKEIADLADVTFLHGLADMWVEDARFAVNYEKIRKGGAKFVWEAVHIYCDMNG